MPGYKTHLTGGAVAGILLGGGAYGFYDASLTTSLLSASFCTVGGLLPDIDSKTSTSFKRCMTIFSGFSTLLLVSRLRDFQLEAEAVILVGGLMYTFISFLVGGLIKRMTVHRGMCHSIPMGVIAAEVIFLLSSGSIYLRVFKGFSIFLGVLVHLILDEFYSVEVKSQSVLKTIHVKKSLGTALKMIDFENIKATLLFYAIIFFLTNAIVNENHWTDQETKRAIHGKHVIDNVRRQYPVQFELAVVEWVAENQLILEPGNENNVKWKELENLFASQNDSTATDAPNSTDAGPSSRLAVPTSQMGQLSSNAASTDSNFTLLDQINWSSRNSHSNDLSPAPSNDDLAPLK